MPLSGRALAARPDVVRFTVENKSSGPLYVWLTGTAFYYLSVGAEKTGVFTVNRGEYDYRFRACGDTVTGTLDLTTQRRIVMPVCGGRAISEAREPSTFDISTQIKIVKIGDHDRTDHLRFHLQARRREGFHHRQGRLQCEGICLRPGWYAQFHGV
jgi:hypothetical protein